MKADEKRKRLKDASIKESAFVRELVGKEVEKLIPIVPKEVLHYGKTGTSVWKAKQNTLSLANRIWTEFANLLAAELVEDNVRFIVPMKGFGIILICSKQPNWRSKKYGNLHSNGKVYQATWRTKISGIKTNVRFRFQDDLKDKFKKKIQKGYHYWQDQ